MAEGGEDAALAERLKTIAEAEGGDTFLGWPERWWDGGRYRCPNDHVSRSLLKTERGRVCLACFEHVTLTFPEDRDGPFRPVSPASDTAGEHVPRPADAPPRFNGGERCDMDVGPCACGAWHTAHEERDTCGEDDDE